MFSCIARASLWRRLGQSSGPYTGPVVNLPRPERRLLSYRDRPSRQTLLKLLSQRHCLAVLSTAVRVVNQSESIYKILKPVLALAHLHRVKLHMYIRPKEKHEIGNICLTHSGGNVLECGQSCPELERPERVCVPSDKPDKGLSKQGQNRKRRDRPDSSRLAQPGVVSGPVRSRNRLSNNSPTSAETAPLSSASVESQPSSLEVIKGFHKERGFSEAAAQRLAISQRQSSAGVYESTRRYTVSGRCSESGAMLSN